jgi:putative ABC transport system permease protein
MLSNALKMLLGDPVKYAGLVFGVAFATLLITQQLAIFTWLMSRSANPVINVSEAQVWVMDPRVRAVEQPLGLPDQAVFRVRGVEGVAWAVPYSRATSSAQTLEGRVVGITVTGLDERSFIGAPRDIDAATLQSLRAPGAIVLDRETVGQIWPGLDPEQAIGRTFEINDNRVVVSGIGNALPGFVSNNQGFMRYAEAVRILPPVRNTMSYVLAQPAQGVSPAVLAARIEAETGLKARTRDQFLWESIRELAAEGGIVPSFATTVLLGIIVGAAITGLTLSLFVQENLRQFGALKAIGVTNGQILGMVGAQTALVGITGFGLGIGGTAAFVNGASQGAAFEGLVLHAPIVWGTALVIALILLLSAALSIIKVLRLDPAVVFR